MAENSYCCMCGSAMPKDYRYCPFCGTRKQYPVLEIRKEGYTITVLDNHGQLSPMYHEVRGHVSGWERFEREALQSVFHGCREQKVTECCMVVPANLDFRKRQILDEVAGEAGVTVKRVITDIAAMALAYEHDRSDRNRDTNCLILVSRDDFMNIGYANLGGGVAEMVLSWSYEEELPDGEIWTQEQKMRLFHAVISMIRNDYVMLDGLQKERQEENISRISGKEEEKYIKEFLQELETVIVPENAEHFIPAIEEVMQWLTGGRKLSVVTESVSKGTMLQAGKLMGWPETNDILLVDGMPVSIGAVLPDGQYTQMIQKNTAIPIKTSRVISAALFSAPGAKISIVQKQEETGSITELATVCPDLAETKDNFIFTVDIDAGMSLKVSICRE